MENIEKEWYVVHTYSGYENTVKTNLEKRIGTMNMEEKIFRVVVPEETEVEIKNGKRKEKNKKVFPGYVLVEMIVTNDAWYVVRNTPGVTGVLGSSGGGVKPVPLTTEEIDPILKKLGLKRIEIDINFQEGDSVKINEGPFTGYNGVVDVIDTDKMKVIVLVDLFGRETPVELEFTQVEIN